MHPDRLADPCAVGVSSGAADTTGGTADEIIWYGPGPAGDSMWTFNGPFGDPASRRLQIDGDYRPLAGNLFDQDAHRTDVLWWGPGTRSDLIWDFTDGDVSEFREEVKVTLLHELGHYLGLDEDEVEELGLA